MHDRRRLPAGDDEPVQSCKIPGQPDLDDVGAQPPEHLRVLAERALQRQHADSQRPSHGRRYQPRSSSRSSSESELAEMPTMGWPSPVETSARTFGSSKCVVASTIARARRATSSAQPSRSTKGSRPDLKMPDPTKTPSAPSCMQRDAS